MRKQPLSGILYPCQEKEATRKYGFTLVELIVVISILAILGTIAFISLQGYSKDARDSTRISDLSAMKTSLELFQLDAGKYPEPTDGFIVSYSGSEVWTQGTFGTITFGNVSKLDKIPTDPLTDKEYTYSVTKTKQEYQFAGIIEGNEITQNLAISQTNAGELIATALVTGTYNGQIIKTENGTNCNILSLPSIISSEPNTTTDLSVILTNKSLVFNGYNNLPTNYISSKYKTNEGFPFESKKIVVYDDSVSCTPLYNPDDNTARVELLTNLQEAYSGTLIENEDSINGVVNLDLTDTSKLDLISATLVNNDLGGSIAVSSDGGEEETTTPTSSLLFLSNCTNGGEIIYTDLIGAEIGRVDNFGETLSGNPGELTCAGHIIVCAGTSSGYILQACNVGANILYTNQSFLDYSEPRNATVNTWAGGLYQRGNNADISYADIGTTRPTCTTDSTFSQAIFITGNNDWCSEKTDNAWGGIDGTNEARKGPCQTNYHIPTNTEWAEIISLLGRQSYGNRLSNTLKLPMAGKRNFNNGTISNQSVDQDGGSAYYWSSSPSGDLTFFMFNYLGGNAPSSEGYRASGYSLRCIKN